ncbi:MAG: LytTR family DNA-binding domain-containing protein [Melioribacteraceae bacterium]|nr:LytTR family DNA-binding domain-containing protein [Melioribacteraceae bacterium]MCF8354429.1 LytTR family DNA-binding domain-containing protein [Melioribacteraceae bacterium]MCF8394039.1 LytTR family DNA-binding domain-containing protein [Melioribacteraceae bacterium]MCF8419805.1 LytTR family DNA-binding domain-containing protein [Melioribacteraceae bacterium]
MHRILIIEDEQSVRENIRTLLKKKNYKVLDAENAEKGIDLAKDFQPDLIVSDIMLPDNDGYYILEELQKDDSTKNIPFIFLTALADMSDLRKGMNLGADDYLTKPFSVKELLLVIEKRIKKNEELRRDDSAVPNEEKELDLEDNFVFTDSGKMNFIKVKDIECILADGVYTEIYMETGTTHLVRKIIKEWEKILPSKHFIRIHRSSIINLNYVLKIDKWFQNTYKVKLKSYPKELEISRRYSAKLKSAFSL